MLCTQVWVKISSFHLSIRFHFFSKDSSEKSKKYKSSFSIYILFLTKWCFYDLHTMKYVSASLHLCKQIICDQAGKYFGILRGRSKIVCICNKRGGGAVKQQSEFSLIYVKLQNSIWIPGPSQPQPRAESFVLLFTVLSTSRQHGYGILETWMQVTSISTYLYNYGFLSILHRHFLEFYDFVLFFWKI